MKTLFRTLLALAAFAAPLNAQRIIELTNQGQLRFFEGRAGGTSKLNFQAPSALAGDFTFTWPIDDGTSGQFLQCDGSGVLSWASAASSLQSAYDGGKTITFSTVSTWSQATNNTMLRLNKTATGAGNPLLIDNAGTDESIRINHSGAGTAFALEMTGNATALLVHNTQNQPCIFLHAAGNSAALQIDQDDDEDAIDVNNADIRGGQLIGTENLVLFNTGGLQFGEFGHGPSGDFFDVLTVNASNQIFLGQPTEDWQLNLSTGATQAMNFIANGATRYSLGPTGLLTSTQASNAGMLSLNKTGSGAGNVLLVDNDGTGIGVSIVQDGAENALRVVQSAAATAVAITQADNTSRGLSLNKSGTGGNPAVDVTNAGTGEGLLVSQDGVGVAVGIDQDADAIALRLDVSTGSAPVIDITNAGTGNDIDGHASTWFATKAGVVAARTLRMQDTSQLTIAGGVVTAVRSVHTIAGEGAAADDLDTINGGSSGDILILRAASDTVTITVTEAGNLALSGSFTMNNETDTITLVFQGTVWYELARSDNGA